MGLDYDEERVKGNNADAIPTMVDSLFMHSPYVASKGNLLTSFAPFHS